MHGKGGHGAEPHNTVDPVLVSAHLITALQSVVSRNVDPLDMGVLTVGSIHGGHASNVIPDSVELKLTARTFRPEVRSLLQQRVPALVEAQAASFGARAEVDYRLGFPPVCNHPAETALAREVAQDTLGAARVEEAFRPRTASEDFAFMLQARPGSFVFFGNGDSAALHNHKYDFNDDTIPYGVALYSAVIDKVVPVSSTRAAEMTKLLENIHRAVNIGLVNEMKIVADKMGIDIHEVIRAAATKPFGFVPYYPGPGLGGHCIPIDPFYLTWKAREYGVNTRFIELAGEVNSAMPDYVVAKVAAALNIRKKAINGSRVLVLGIAYKKNVDDMRESPSVFLMEKLRDLGAEVSYSDPHVPVFPKMREHHFELSSVTLDAATIASYDCVLLATDHDKFDYAALKEHAQLIVDSRGKYLEPADHIVKA